MHVFKNKFVLIFLLGLLTLSYGVGIMTVNTGSSPHVDQVSGVIHIGVMVNTHGNITKADTYQSLTRTAMSYVSFTLTQENILPLATIEFTYAYTNGTARNATAALVSLYQQGIRFVIGPETDIEFQAVLPVAKSLGMILLSPWTTSDVLFDVSKFSNAMLMRPGNALAGEALVDMLDTFGITRVAVISCHVPSIIDEEVAFNQLFLNKSYTIVYADRIMDLNNRTLINTVVGNAVGASGIQAAMVFAPPKATSVIGEAFNDLGSDIPVFFSRHATEENVFAGLNSVLNDRYIGLSDPIPHEEFRLIFQNRQLSVTSREGFLHDAAITLAKAIDLAETNTNTTKISESLGAARSQLLKSNAYVLDGYSPIKFIYLQIQKTGVTSVGSWFNTNRTTFNDDFQKIRGNLEPVTKTIVSTKGGFLAVSLNPWLLLLFTSAVLVRLVRKRK